MSKLFYLVFTLFLVQSSAITFLAQQGCQYIINATSVYNLLDFAAATAITNPANRSTTKNWQLTFSLCERQVFPCGSDAKTPNFNKKNYIYGTLTDTSTGKCENVTTAASPTASFLYDETKGGIRLAFPSVQNTTTQNVTFVVELTCNPNILLEEIVWTVTVGGNQNDAMRNVTVTGIGEPGCPAITYKGFIQFYDQHKYFFVIALIGAGLLAMLSGLKFFKITIYTLTALSIFLVGVIVVLENYKSEITTTEKWIISIVFACLGIGLGYLATLYEKASFFVLGLIFGGIGGFCIYLFLRHTFSSFSVVFAYILVVIAGLAAAFVALKLWKDLVIIMTSLIGAYLFVRGFACVIGGFPSELSIIQGQPDINSWAYVYLVVILIVAMISGIYQYRRKGKMDNEEELDYFKKIVRRITQHNNNAYPTYPVEIDMSSRSNEGENSGQSLTHPLKI